MLISVQTEHTNHQVQWPDSKTNPGFHWQYVLSSATIILNALALTCINYDFFMKILSWVMKCSNFTQRIYNPKYLDLVIMASSVHKDLIYSAVWCSMKWRRHECAISVSRSPTRCTVWAARVKIVTVPRVSILTTTPCPASTASPPTAPPRPSPPPPRLPSRLATRRSPVHSPAPVAPGQSQIFKICLKISHWMNLYLFI